MSLTVRKIGYMVTVRLDDDGTPLTPDGERMVQVKPGEWMDPLGVALMASLTDEMLACLPADL